MNSSSTWLRAFRYLHRAFARPAHRQRTPVLGLLSALTLYYTFVVTAGTFGLLHWRSDFFDQLTQGMRAGHLYVLAQPAPELLARQDPYTWESPDDWAAWKWDFSLYHGRYYLYFGPTPALLLWLVKAVFRYAGTLHDQWLVLFFSLLRLYAGTGLIVRFAHANSPTLPRWALYLAILVFGLASPTPYVLTRPLVYEASIACGQGFLCLGLYCAYRGLLAPLLQTRWFLAAGSCLACALAARASLIITAPLLVVATAVCAQRPAGYPPRKLLGSLCSLGIPVAASLALYAIYNQQRFGAFYEFGLKYQLTGRRVESAGRYFWPNIASYLSAELSWSCKFPFVRLPAQRHLTAWITWPEDYDLGGADNGERVGGLLVATTFCWLWSVWLWRALRWVKRKYAGRRVRYAVPAAFSSGELWWVMSSLAMIASAAPASRMYLASMRYLADAASGVLLGAIAAGFWLLRPTRAASPTRRLLGPALYTSLALHTVLVGVCLGFTGYADNFGKENKALFGQLERTLSVCGIKRQLRRLTPHALRTFESDPIYVASDNAQHFVSRDTYQERPAARP